MVFQKNNDINFIKSSQDNKITTDSELVKRQANIVNDQSDIIKSNEIIHVF